jgi:hypothetical protein
VKKCSVSDCGREVCAKGYCKRHYYIERRHGRLARSTADNSGPCSVNGCGRPATKLGLCGGHYKRKWKTGSVFGHGKAMRGEPEAWLRRHATFAEVGCLEWPFGRSKSGYGHLEINGYEAPASRHMAILIHGPLQSDVHVRHTCDNPPCCNPQHLVLGSALDNYRDSVERGRHISPPHKAGESNGSAKLSAADVKLIRALYARGEKRFPIAKQFGVSFSTVDRIVSGDAWQDIA